METIFLLLCGLGLSFFMAWNLGANDAATPTDCAVGSGVISVKKALILFGVFSAIGAIAQGHMNIKTIGSGIVPEIDVLGALTITLSACLWVTFCTWKGLEISNTYSVIGAVIGYGIITYGPLESMFNMITLLFTSWIISPICSMALSFSLYKILNRILSKHAENKQLEKAISYFLIGTLCFSAYSFGANDVGNATGVYFTVAQNVGNIPTLTTTLLLSVFGAIGIVIGGLTWGYKVIETVAYRIIHLDVISGFSAELTNALIVYLFVTLPYIFFGFGLPISTSISSVGAIIGAGLGKDPKAVNKSTVTRLVLTWGITVPATATISLIIYKVATAILI
ncbi:MAG: inorganic phosphate transporter [Candidatus Bathyarchaeia archaeon]